MEKIANISIGFETREKIKKEFKKIADNKYIDLFLICLVFAIFWILIIVSAAC